MSTEPINTNVTSHRWEGVITARSSIHQGGEKAGTISYLRREKIVQPDGSTQDIPVISGNGIRGILRRHSAQITWESLGKPKLSRTAFDALWSGGSLQKSGSGMSHEQLKQLRRLVPHVSLFGASGGGRIIEGRLEVGKAIPVCKQTEHLLPANLVESTMPDIHDLLAIEEYTRLDDRRLGRADRVVGDGAVGGQLLAVPETTTDDHTQMMRYGFEVLAAGTMLYWSVALKTVTSYEVSQFAAAMNSWAESGAAVGGRSAIGHGRIAFDIAGWDHAAPALTASTDQLPEADVDGWLADNAEGAVEALTWLA